MKRFKDIMSFFLFNLLFLCSGFCSLYMVISHLCDGEIIFREVHAGRYSKLIYYMACFFKSKNEVGYIVAGYWDFLFYFYLFLLLLLSSLAFFLFFFMFSINAYKTKDFSSSSPQVRPLDRDNNISIQKKIALVIGAAVLSYFVFDFMNVSNERLINKNKNALEALKWKKETDEVKGMLSLKIKDIYKEKYQEHNIAYNRSYENYLLLFPNDTMGNIQVLNIRYGEKSLSPLFKGEITRGPGNIKEYILDSGLQHACRK